MASRVFSLFSLLFLGVCGAVWTNVANGDGGVVEWPWRLETEEATGDVVL